MEGLIRGMDGAGVNDERRLWVQFMMGLVCGACVGRITHPDPSVRYLITGIAFGA